MNDRNINLFKELNNNEYKTFLIRAVGMMSFISLNKDDYAYDEHFYSSTSYSDYIKYTELNKEHIFNYSKDIDSVKDKAFLYTCVNGTMHSYYYNDKESYID